MPCQPNENDPAEGPPPGEGQVSLSTLFVFTAICAAVLSFLPRDWQWVQRNAVGGWAISLAPLLCVLCLAFFAFGAPLALLGAACGLAIRFAGRTTCRERSSKLRSLARVCCVAARGGAE
jgi:hypothetical protein